ncbi:MAG: pyruvate kinase alpha/beta domain-containing protein [Gemmatimonadota bacterium]
MTTGQITYFDRPGKENTAAVLEAVRRRVEALGIGHVVVASTSGETALKACEALKGTGAAVVCVGEHCGFWGGDSQKMEAQMRTRLEELGVAVFIGSHALSGVGRSVTSKLGGVSHVEVIAHTLRRFGGDGIKVAVEVAVMAADAGLIPTDREVVAVGGTGSGADAAVVLQAAHMNNFFDLEIREIVAKPRQRAAEGKG